MSVLPTARDINYVMCALTIPRFALACTSKCVFIHVCMGRLDPRNYCFTSVELCLCVFVCVCVCVCVCVAGCCAQPVSPSEQ